MLLCRRILLAWSQATRRELLIWISRFLYGAAGLVTNEFEEHIVDVFVCYSAAFPSNTPTFSNVELGRKVPTSIAVFADSKVE
jgi:hypothetical protein